MDKNLQQKEVVNSGLHRGLKNRHIQLIAFGGAIGTGLFLAVSGAIAITGPAIILGYLIAGLFIFLFMRQLGEMDTEEPMAGSFGYFANKYWGKFPGFLAGYNYWILYIIVAIAELTGTAAYIHFWFPNIPTWITVLFFFIIINMINLTTVEAYGEMEFWFASIKIAAICAIIAIGFYILVINPHLIDGASFTNLWSAAPGRPKVSAWNGFFPNGIKSLLFAIPIILFSFGGLELIGITAAETDNPKKTIPKAVNQVILRILFFYIGTMIVILSLHHWTSLIEMKGSPFVIVFDEIGFIGIASVFNFVVLTAALSAYNSCVYCTTRMFYALSLQGNAPKIFTKTTKRGVPARAIFLTAALTFPVVPLNYFLPHWFDAFAVALALVVSTLILSWGLITLTHLHYKKQKRKENYQTFFPAPLFPFSDYLCISFLLFSVSIMAFKLHMVKAILAIPVWIIFVYICYRLTEKLREEKFEKRLES
jgi:L-asparagine transporter-like permease